MGYQREFDPEIGEESLRACLNDGALQGRKSYALSVSTSSASLTLTLNTLFKITVLGRG